MASGAGRVINYAYIIIYVSGTANSSLYPTYLTKGLSKVITRSSAQKMMLVNIGADYETADYKASDFIRKNFYFLDNHGDFAYDNKIYID